MATRREGYLVIEGLPVPKLFKSKEAAERFLAKRRHDLRMALAQKALADLMCQDLTQDELRLEYALALSECVMLRDELSRSQEWFDRFLNDFKTAKDTLGSSLDIADARRKLERGLTFRIDTLIAMTHDLARTSQARRAALALHAKATPKKSAKAFVYECFLDWKANPTSYKGTAAFARDMVAKFPDELSSTAVIERWVRRWRGSANG